MSFLSRPTARPIPFNAGPADEMEWTEEEIDRRFSIGKEIPL